MMMATMTGAASAAASVAAAAASVAALFNQEGGGGRVAGSQSYRTTTYSRVECYSNNKRGQGSLERSQN